MPVLTSFQVDVTHPTHLNNNFNVSIEKCNGAVILLTDGLRWWKYEDAPPSELSTTE